MRQFLVSAGSLVTLCAPCALAAAPTIYPLDGVPGSRGVSARAMAADGTVVGGNSVGGQATVWTKGSSGYAPQLLPLLAGQDDGFANAVNSGGTIAGYQVDQAGNPTATVWQRGGASGAYAASALPVPSGAVGASAYAINASGQVAGFGVTATGSTFGVVWQPLPAGYVAQPLDAPAAMNTSYVATAINDRGVVAGYGEVADAPYVPAVWEGGRGKGVIVVQGAVATAINNNGVGAGVDTSSGDVLPMAIAPYEGDYYGATLPINGVGGYGASNHVNNNDVLVGNAVDPTDTTTGHVAALWNPTDTYWDYVNLQTWLTGKSPTLGQRWTLRDANFISDSGWVVGDGVYNAYAPFVDAGYERSFVMDVSSIAAPEPGARAWVGVVGIGLLGRRRTQSSPSDRG
jgi:hypothetical protein